MREKGRGEDPQMRGTGSVEESGGRVPEEANIIENLLQEIEITPGHSY